MYTIHPTKQECLPDVAACQVACFPDSLATKLGKGYVQKSLEWFLDHPRRFLFHVMKDGKVAGYCGGFMPSRLGDGSSSGMLQHAFSKAIKGILVKPWLAFHPEVVQYYPFIWRNIKRKFTSSLQPAPSIGTAQPFKPYVGLVVIGVHPKFRGSGVAQTLMAEFEKRALMLNQCETYLTVKKDNPRAIKAYQKFGWLIDDEKKDTYLMKKIVARKTADV